MRKTLICAAALMALGAAASSADASIKVRNGVFKVQLEGVQKNTWSTQHTKQFACDHHSKGGGTETVRFRTKPVLVRGVQVGHSRPLFVNHKKPGKPEMRVYSTINRQGKIDTWGGEVCAYGDGTGGDTPKPASDCGTKRDDGVWLDLEYGQHGKELVTLEQQIVRSLEVYRHCPSGSGAYPDFLDRNTNGKHVGRRLPIRDLFGYGLNILVGRGKYVSKTAEGSSTTTIRWSLRIQRVKTRKGRR